MMLDFDTDAAKARLEAVAWIRHAQVMRLLPSTLQVVVEERTPLRRLAEQGPDLRGRCRGRRSGAGLARSLCRACLWSWARARRSPPPNCTISWRPIDDLKQKLIAAIRVGDRRWTLKLASGLEIMLPDDNVGEALNSLAKLDAERGLLKRDIAAVDLTAA